MSLSLGDRCEGDAVGQRGVCSSYQEQTHVFDLSGHNGTLSTAGVASPMGHCRRRGWEVAIGRRMFILTDFYAYECGLGWEWAVASGVLQCVRMRCVQGDVSKTTKSPPRTPKALSLVQGSGAGDADSVLGRRLRTAQNTAQGSTK